MPSASFLETSSSPVCSATAFHTPRRYGFIAPNFSGKRSAMRVASVRKLATPLSL